ncbi:MAG: hypothetical protein C0467_29840 [Planctomycetaceae bacterium]|nr:hypothetical protein [Planctomycetaceae bacterium]
MRNAGTDLEETPMLVAVSCGCGHSFTVPQSTTEAATVGTVFCPQCQSVLRLPDVTNEPPSTVASHQPAPVDAETRSLAGMVALSQQYTLSQTPNLAVAEQTSPPDTLPEGSRSGSQEVPVVASQANPRDTPPAIPGYRIDGELGRGGMGVVYKAENVALKRTVALKMILASGHAGFQERERFRTETEAVARLQHPNIVQIHEVGEYSNQPYCALEYVEGGTLASKISGKPLSPSDAARTVESLARAMHMAHSRNIIHRDLKPANVLISADGTPKVTDFGLAKRLDDDSGYTQAGAIMGTPSYMAPEQAEGETNSAGPAADIYALGAIFYECLTGRPPFKGKSVLDTLQQVRSQEPVPPSRDHHRVPADLETICLKCLQKKPEKRYASAESLADDLRRWRLNEPIEARPVGRAERTYKLMRRNPAISTLLAIVVIAVLGGFAGTYAKYLDAIEQEAIVARKAVDLAEANGRLDEALKQQAVLIGELKREKLEVEKQTTAVKKQLARAEFVAYAFRLNDAASDLARGDFGHASTVLAACNAEQCGWEHEYLLGLCRTPYLSSVFDRPFHTRVIRDVAIRHDGKRVVSASDDSTLKVCEVETARELFTLSGHKGTVNGVSYSPDGTRIASCSGDIRNSPGVVKIWNADTGQEVFTFTGHKAVVYCVCFSPDGKHIASGDQQGNVIIWDVESGQPIHTLKLFEHNTSRVCFNPLGGQLAASGEGSKIKIWTQVGTQTTTAELNGHKSEVSCLSFSSNGDRLISGATDGGSELRVWNLRNLPQSTEIKVKTTGIAGVTFLPGESLICGVTQDGLVILWDASSGSQVAMLDRMTDGGVTRACFSADRTRIAASTFKGLVAISDFRPDANPLVINASKEFITDAAMSPDGTQVATADRLGDIKLWDVRTGRLGLVFQVPAGFSRYVAFSSDGTRIITAGHEDRKENPNSGRVAGPIRVHEASTGRVLFTWPGGFSRPSLSPDGKRIATDGKLLEVETGKEVRPLKYRGEDVKPLGFHPNGKRLLCSAGNIIVVFDTETGDEVRTLVGHTYALITAAYSPDGKRIVSGGNDRTVRVWDAETGAAIFTLLGHTGNWIQAVQFSPDGKRILSAGGGPSTGELKLWDAETGQEAIAMKDAPWWTRGAGFSADGRNIFAAGQDGRLRIYKTTPIGWVRAFQGHKSHVFAARVSDDGKRVATASVDGTVKLWDSGTGKELHSITVPDGALRAMDLSPDGRLLATGTFDSSIKLWDTETGQVNLTIDKKFVGNRVNAIQFTPDSQWIVYCTDSDSNVSNVLQMCSVTSGLPREGFTAKCQQAFKMHISANGSRILAIARGGDLLDGLTGQRVPFSAPSSLVVRCGHLSSDGKFAILVTDDGTLSLRDVASSKDVLKLKNCRVAAFSPDDKWIVTAERDWGIRLRPLANPDAAILIGQHVSEITGVSFTADGKQILTSSTDRTAKLWGVPTKLERH